MNLACLRNAKQPMRLFTEAELRQRLGSLDVDAVAMEITMSTNELDEHMEVPHSTWLGDLAVSEQVLLIPKVGSKCPCKALGLLVNS